jgi:class 3 adenylate cyclase
MLILSSAARPLASAIGSDMKGNVWPLPQAAAILIALAAPLVSYGRRARPSDLVLPDTPDRTRGQSLAVGARVERRPRQWVGTLRAMIPETQYARLGDLHIAYQVLGEGPPDILLLDQWFGHLDAQWDVAPLAELRERLAALGRLIMFDKRGTGLSDPIPTSSLPTLEEFMADIPAILDTVGSERPALIANIGGGMLAMPYAAAHPERVSSLILVDCFARFVEAPDFPIGAPLSTVGPALEAAERETGRGVMVDLFAPSVANDVRLRRAWARYERSAVTPGSAEAIVRLIYESDVRDVLPAIRVPTLVIHRRDAIAFGIEHGRYLSKHIPDARLVEMPGPDNLIWAGDLEAMVAEIQAFVTGVRPAPEPRRVLLTVLFTDIVGSTERAAQLGDVRWQGLLDDHNRVVRRQLERFGGNEVKVIGDGFLATFDGPARAVRCAIAIRDDVKDLGLEIRAGIHIGEIEVLPDDIAGLAVHLGARVSALAGPGEVLVSSTVKDLVVGSGIVFADRGSHFLKGVPGEWRLFAVVASGRS